MNKSRLSGVFPLLFCCMFSIPASATTYNLFASIDSNQEVPTNTSLATGTGVITYDDVSNNLNWDISWTGLNGDATGMHFHGAASPGNNAGVQVNIGSISGLISHSIGSTSISASQGNDLLDGLWYINIHTASYPSGEIRGQVEAVPVPAAIWLFGSGLVGLTGMAARKKKACKNV